MKKLATKALIRILKAIVYGVIGASLMLVAVGIYVLNRKPDLKVWHTVELDEEFTTSSDVNSFAEYLQLEERLFAQLDEKVYARIDAADKRLINRYHRGSLSDPQRWPRNWNRSFELTLEQPDAVAEARVLLLHGLSDSPYSMRNLAERLHDSGAYVLGLRIPGHGTAPAALTDTSWQDMAAAVTLAMRHVQQQAGDGPLYIVGYSNGGALAVQYALSTMENSSLPAVTGIVLISPEIGITAMASLAIWQERIGRVLGLDKLGWNGVVPEYDPYKYASFPVNAGNLAHQLTSVNREHVARLAAVNKLQAFPPVLAFQSAVDATVSAAALVQNLFAQLPDQGHELVVFDVNRGIEVGPLLKTDPKSEAEDIVNHPSRTFTFSVLTNADSGNDAVIERTWKSGQVTPTETDTALRWPRQVYSLSHVALPFPGRDPLYGGDQPEDSPGIQLGQVALRGEKGVLLLPASDMLRLRWNPFYPYLEQRIMTHLKPSSD